MIANSELPSPSTGMLMTAGQLFLNRHRLVVNYCAMAAIKVAYDYASASRENFNGLLFATVVDCVFVANV